ncbi:hypothetical protein ACN28E_54605 [Archangium lansingense]|uniref:hypothetical protein n=1 Tax=Archangium lansingense TaxID=2995310 RepID=UPI003B808D8E
MSMTFLDRLMRRDRWHLDLAEAPWAGRPSLHDFLVRHTRPDGKGLTPEGQNLPDEQVEPGAIHWAAGAKDGVRRHHFGSGSAEGRVREVVESLRAVLGQPDAERLAALYTLLRDGETLAVVDEVLEALRAEARAGAAWMDVERLHTLALWLATRAADREPVKFGLAMLGLFTGFDDTEVLHTLGQHDEFTLYAAVVLSNSGEDSEAALFALAQRVHGWGRVHLVERLAEDAKSPALRRWLVREGFRNSVMYEYLAHVCAVGGGLREQLDVSEPDDALLSGASLLWVALLAGGPAPDVDSYEDGAAAAELLFGHLERRASRLEHYQAVDAQLSWLLEEANWNERASRGWTPEVRARLQARCEALLERPLWRGLAEQGLASEDPVTFHRAAIVGGKVGADVWSAAFRRYTAGDLGQSWWLVRTEDPECARRFVAATLEALDFAQLCTGPTSQAGFGPDFEKHHAHELALGVLPLLPGEGWALVKAGLCSPSVRVRDSALKVLGAWPEWPVGAAEALRAAHAREPDEDLKVEAAALLAR